ncbi:hypothetical protein SF123566_5994 [Shigella flexneri 1235-66]|nr:hypothetical protein SF123566_5994 [Shigella flexneri 1235-66]
MIRHTFRHKSGDQEVAQLCYPKMNRINALAMRAQMCQQRSIGASNVQHKSPFQTA